MARDKELLSDKEFFSKTCHIIEQVRDCKINITYYDEENLVKEEVSRAEADAIPSMKKSHTYRLNVATPAVKGIEKFTAFNHEAGHILGETPIAEAREVIESWTHADETQRKQQGMNIYKMKDGAVREKTYWDMFNILEDQRIEDLMTKIWLANNKRFTKARTNRGKLHTKCNDNPIDVMLNLRFFREDLVKRKHNWREFKEALEDVVGTGRMGAILVLTKIKPLIDKFHDDKVKEEKRLLNLHKHATTPETKSKHEKNIMKNAKNAHEAEPFDGTDHKQLNKNNTKPNPDGSKFNPSQIPKEHEKEKIQSSIEKEKENQKKDIKKIQSVMSGGNGKLEATAVPSYVTRVKRQSQPVVVNNVISGGLKKIFRKISEMPKEKIGYDGDEIDMDSFIEGKVRGYDISNCFIDKKMSYGASIVISIDGSGSMRGNSITQVRNLVATLYESIKGLPNIEMKANVWSSNGKGDCGITDINNKEDCKLINVMESSYYFTPTHLALDYSSRQLKQMKGRKKLLIMITDGVPQYQNNHFNMKRDVLLKMTRKSMLKVMRTTPHVMILHVGRHGYIGGLGMSTSEYLKHIFGSKRMMSVPSMYDVTNEVVKRFQDLVVRTLK